MLEVKLIDTFGFEGAIEAMRNPWDSWDKSDSGKLSGVKFDDNCEMVGMLDDFVVGEDDMALMRKLFRAGVEHRTYARMLAVQMRINAPLYWWKEMDRYTIGKSQVSCSTMHTIARKEFTFDDFSIEHLYPENSHVMYKIVEHLNYYREKYLETKDMGYWWQMIQMLPSSYNQQRTVMISYEVAFKIIKERTGHKLDEWNTLVEFLKGLPYMEDIMNEEVLKA